VRPNLIKFTVPALIAALFVLVGSRTVNATIAMTGQWHFSIVGDLTLTCPTTLNQTGTSLTGTFDCTQYVGTLQGIVAPKVHGQSFQATVLFTDQQHNPLDAWDVTGDVPGDGNTMTGTWSSTVIANEAGTLSGTRNVSVYLKGDVNCDGDVDAADALTGARWSANLDPLQQPGCPALGSDFAGEVFSDVDCDGVPTVADALDVLKYAARIPVGLPQGCLPIGELYTVPG
jgi:hypothetical protein